MVKESREIRLSSRKKVNGVLNDLCENKAMTYEIYSKMLSIIILYEDAMNDMSIKLIEETFSYYSEVAKGVYNCGK